MSYDYKGASGLVFNPSTQVQTFPSGLLLVQKQATIRKGNIDSARNQLRIGNALSVNVPAIDGVHIFPQPQESESDGFTVLNISAYGRSNLEGRFTTSISESLSQDFFFQGPWYQAFGTLVNPPAGGRGVGFNLKTFSTSIRHESVVRQGDLLSPPDLSQFIGSRLFTITPTIVEKFPGPAPNGLTYNTEVPMSFRLAFSQSTLTIFGTYLATSSHGVSGQQVARPATAGTEVVVATLPIFESEPQQVSDSLTNFGVFDERVSVYDTNPSYIFITGVQNTTGVRPA